MQVPKKSLIIFIIGILMYIGAMVYENNRAIEPIPENIIEELSYNNNESIQEIEKIDRQNTEPEVLHPMAIESLRQRAYIGGDFTIVEKLANGTNYKQFIASYESEGLTIYGLLTEPLGEKPDGGWPAVLFIHGYIPPKQYSTTDNYPTYQARLARRGFVTFKPDLRGHGNSEGEPVSAHYSEKYVVDTLYALEYLKQYPAVNAEKIVYWGHSNGGEIGLRVVLVSPDIKAASLWAGVVGSYVDMFETYNAEIHFLRDAQTSDLVVQNGLPSTESDFWQSVDPFYYLEDITMPIQLQHGTADASVPVALSLSLSAALEAADKTVEYYEYPGDDHNIGLNVSRAFERTIDFYEEALKKE